MGRLCACSTSSGSTPRAVDRVLSPGDGPKATRERRHQARYIFDGSNALEHLRRDVDPEPGFNVRDELHHAEAVQTQVVLDVIRGPDRARLVDVAPEKLSR